MSKETQKRPDPDHLPGTSFRTEHRRPHDAQGQPIPSSQTTTQSSAPEVDNGHTQSNSYSHNIGTRTSYFAGPIKDTREFPVQEVAEDAHSRDSINLSSERTVAPSIKAEERDYITLEKSTDASTDTSSDSNEVVAFEPIKTGVDTKRPGIKQQGSRRPTEADIFRALSRRDTGRNSRHQSYISSAGDDDGQEEEIERLLSRMFGKDRQAQSEDEQTRHVGVIFKNLTVKGVGLGASLQPSVGDLFMNPFRLVKGLLSNPRNTVGKPPVRNLLNSLTGCIAPGEMLLVLGRPGAGSSTFLKVTGNQRSGYESVHGNVTYGGESAENMGKHYRGEILYNPEDDLHYATLSVKNTLSFALTTRTPSKASRNEGETRSHYVEEFLRVVTKLFWIEHTLATKVGDEDIRGVSGGEKKRVSIAEAMITKASMQAWDNSTRGLDASTALEYVASLRSLTSMARISTAVALYQAGESLYNLFDKVLLIDEGRCLYFGRTETAVEYFEGLGFQRPTRWTTADFLTSVSDKHERRVKEGWEDRIPHSAEQFEKAFDESEIQKANLEDISGLESKLEEQRQARLSAATQATSEKNYSLSFHQQVFALTRRQFQIMVGDRQSLFGKWGGILFQSLIIGSLFYNLPKDATGVFPRGGVLFLLLLFNALLALAELTASFSARPILLKHKTQFYRPSAFALAQTFVDVPLVLVQVSIFSLVTYFMSGLQRTPNQFFICLLILFIITMTMYAFFRAVGALVENLDIATRITGVAIQALVTYTGYLIPPSSMRPWLKWLWYINPVGYGFEALMANEFYNLEISCSPPYLVPIGPNVIPGHQSCLLRGSKPGQTTVQGSDYLSASFEYSRDHLWRNFGILVGFFLFFSALTALGMELQKPNKGGGAVTIFKRGESKSVETALAKGTSPHDEETASDSSDVKHTDGLMDTDGGGGEKNIVKNSVLTWQNVNYTIPIKNGERKLLQDVQGLVRPGKLVALMGASGAGKTTLLNALAHRLGNFGTVTGDFLIDGRPLPISFQRNTSFAEQMDIHEPTSTVREALQFSALLRRPKEVSTQEKYDYCETIIDLLEMRNIAGAIVGTTGSGLNQEQRKRLTIGVELASKPELLMFLDEPTSGLDSNAAFNIVRFLRKLADSGQAILCTIHQPSSVLFEHFDELLLLKSGGRVVYNGELGHDSRQLIDYFERNGAKPCPKKANPAEWMLEVIGAGDPGYKGKDWADAWEKAPEHEARSSEIQKLIEERRAAGSDKSSLVDDREYAMGLSAQIVAVVKRSFTAYNRCPDYIIGKFSLHIITGLFNCFTFYKLGFSSIDMQSRVFSIFSVLTIAPPLIQQLQPRFLASRQIFQTRERNSKIYSWFAFVLGSTLVESPYSIVAGTLYMCCWYFGSIGPDRPGISTAYTWLLLMLFELFYVGFGQAIASFSPNELLASILVPMFFLFVVSFCGVVVPFSALPPFWRSWMYYLTPFRYLLEGFLGAAVSGLPVVCAENEFARFTAPPGLSCENYTSAFVEQVGGYVQVAADGVCEFCQYATGDEFAASFNVYWSNRWGDYGIFAAYCVFNFLVVFVSSYLYLGGGRKLFSSLSPAARKAKKVRKTANEKA